MNATVLEYGNVSPKYIVEWVEVVPLGWDEGGVQVGFDREACASLEEVRAELRSGWKDPCHGGFKILVRNEAGTYDYMGRDAAMDEFISSLGDRA